MEQEFDDLMKSIIAKKAPTNFTSKTIQHISNQLEIKEKYKPIIPQGVWFILATLFIVLIIFISLKSNASNVDLRWFYNFITLSAKYLIYLFPLLFLLFMDGVARLKLNP